MSRLAFDIETNGLLDETTKIHCIVAIDIDTREVWRYDPTQIAEGVEKLRSASFLIAHNGIKFDHPAIEKITGVCLDKSRFFDTLVASRLIYSNIKDIDAVLINRYRAYMARGGVPHGKPCLPPKLYGLHGLEAWGWRLGEYKGDFGKQNDWSTYSIEMMEYCEQDVWVLVKLYEKFVQKMGEFDFTRSLHLEHDAAWLLAQQERNGFVFDEEKAFRLHGILTAQREVARMELVALFGGWWAPNGVTTPKRTINAKPGSRAISTMEGAPYTKIKWVDFNPGSRLHIIRVATGMGWVPTEFTESGQPKVDDEVLSKLDLPGMKPIVRFLMLQKRLGQLAEGDQAWLHHVKNGKIHGSVNPNGAVTGRATHANPNIAQVPSCGAEFGPECRELFTVPEGWVLMGSDASGLELRCLGHAMEPYDGGRYIAVVLNGDIHWENAQAAGFIPVGTIRDSHNPEHEAARNAAKRFIYAFLYGAGDELIGQLVGYSNADYLRWKKEEAHKSVINRLKRQGVKPTKQMICHILKGGEVKARFLKGLPALKKLIDHCKAQAKDVGHIIGLDGRKVYCRSPHSSLNTLLQSAGALVCKHWIVTVDRLAREAGLKHGWDGDYAFCAWVHDEVQVACRTRAIAEQMGQICAQAMSITEKYFDFRCPLGSEYKIGASWKETH